MPYKSITNIMFDRFCRHLKYRKLMDKNLTFNKLIDLIFYEIVQRGANGVIFEPSSQSYDRKDVIWKEAGALSGGVTESKVKKYVIKICDKNKEDILVIVPYSMGSEMLRKIICLSGIEDDYEIGEELLGRIFYRLDVPPRGNQKGSNRTIEGTLKVTPVGDMYKAIIDINGFS